MNEPEEVSICMDPIRPWNLFGGANVDNYYISHDTGHTWIETNITSDISEVMGDPCLVVDTAGDVYYFHLSYPLVYVVCRKKFQHRHSPLESAIYNGPKVQDKPWATVNRHNNHLFVTWTQDDAYQSGNPKDSSIILFSRSTDAGENWSKPKRISVQAGNVDDSDNTVEGAVPAVGPNGEIYVSWAGPNGLVFNRSDDEGETWLPHETRIDSIPGGWAYDIPGLVRAGGLPITACDTSRSPYRGSIYVNWSDQRNGTDNTDIWLARSSDGGKTWSKPTRVNDDNSNRHQFMSWMTIDQATGYLYVLFYDRRNYVDNHTDVYLAESRDGGHTFANYRISEKPFIPISRIFLGDYINITAYNGIIRPMWMRWDSNGLSIWSDITPLSRITSVPSVKITDEALLSARNYPNPAAGYTYVAFELDELSTVNLSIYNLQGKLIGKVLTDQKMTRGEYNQRIDFGGLNLGPGSYFIRLDVNSQTEMLKLIVN
jgi:hypothetical protein